MQDAGRICSTDAGCTPPRRVGSQAIYYILQDSLILNAPAQMYRRSLLTAVGVTAVAGCLGDSQSESKEEEDDTINPQGQQFYFQDETGTLGQLGEATTPEDAADWQVINNDLSEDDWQEMQINDIEETRAAIKQGPDPNYEGLRYDLDKILDETVSIYQQQDFNVVAPDFMPTSIENEDEEITFTRALVKAANNAGINSSGLADIVIAGMAEYAVQELDIVEFEDYKLSTVPSTEAIPESGLGGHVAGIKDGEGNSGFRHMAGFLQYNKNGDTEIGTSNKQKQFKQ